MNIAALVSYDGTRYSGFQRQPAEKGPTIQAELETAIARVTSAPARITAAGRTDTGVHATGQVVNFHTSARLGALAWRNALNAHLPPDIAIRATRIVDDDFHARKSAVSRRYRYRIICDPVRSPLRERYAWRVARRLDVEAMSAAAALLPGERDFGAFGSSPWDNRADGYRGHTVRRLILARCQWLPPRAATDDDPLADRGAKPPDSDEIAFDFAANAFLTGMVRRLVGTLALTGEGRLTTDGFRAILDGRDKARAGPAAPPQGLSLTGVAYPPEALTW